MKIEDFGISKDTFQNIVGYIDEVKELLSKIEEGTKNE